MPANVDGGSVGRALGAAGRRWARGVAPLRPRARIQAAAAEPGVLEQDEVVAGRDARAAVGDDGLAAVDAGRGEALSQALDRQQPAVGPEVLARGQAARARDVA